MTKQIKLKKCSKCDWFKKLGSKCYGCSPILIDWEDRDKITNELTPFEKTMAYGNKTKRV